MTWYKHIVISLTVAIALLVGASMASAQNITAYTGVPFTFTVDVQTAQEDNIVWEIYDNYTGINLAVVPGNCPITSGEFVGGDNTGSSVDIIWYIPGIYLVKVHATNDCPTDNMEVYLIEVLQSLPEANLDDPGVICEGDTTSLVINLTGDAPWTNLVLKIEDANGVSFVTYPTITATPFIINVNPTITTTYTVTELTNIDGTNFAPSNSVTLIVNPRPLNSPIYQYVP